MLDTFRFKNDTALRRKLMTPESFAHPAKMAIGLLQEIAARYDIKPGDWVLDPMSGSGTTAILALQGINCCLVELEPHFILPMRASWEKIRQHPMLGCTLGEVLILRGDARHLPIASADHIVTSPPFQAVEAFEDKAFMEREGKAHYSGGSAERDGRSHFSGYTRPSAIITSPPYEGSLQGDEPTGKLFETERRVNSPASGNRKSLRKPLGQGYTRPVDAEEGGAATTQLKCTCGVAAVITSPSYEGTNIGRSESMGEAPFGGPHSQARGAQYANGNAENIGNMRGQAYWGENGMTAVYRECFRCLRPGGLMVLVLKGFVRAGVYQDLPAETQSLCESLGFVKFDEWRRELWSLSFWRILQKRRDPAAFDERLNYETVLAFRKTAMTV